MIGLSFGVNAGYAINPARDFGPRLFSAIIYGKDVFTGMNNAALDKPRKNPFSRQLLLVDSDRRAYLRSHHRRLHLLVLRRHLSGRP